MNDVIKKGSKQLTINREVSFLMTWPPRNTFRVNLNSTFSKSSKNAYKYFYEYG